MLIAPYARSEKAFVDYMKKLERLCPPPIPFKLKKSSANEKSSGKDDSEDDERNFRSFSVKIDVHDDMSESFKQKVRVFDDGTPEEWCQWRLDAEELFNMMGFTTEDEDDAHKQFNIYRSLLTGKTKERWNAAYADRETQNEARAFNQRHSFRHVLKQVLNDVAKAVFPKPETDFRTQLKYMKTFLWIGNTSVKEFTTRVEKIDRMLPFFPKFGNNRIRVDWKRMSLSSSSTTRNVLNGGSK
jgi:hypothetical protein